MTFPKIVLGTVAAVLISSLSAFAQNPPPSQTVGGITSRERDMEKNRVLQKQIESKKPEAAVTNAQEPIEDSGPKFQITKINVVGSSLLTPSEISSITGQFEGKEISLKQAQKAADLISDEYRKKGYVTSRAYIPPQRVQGGVLEIRVIEGRLGNLQIQGNKHFSKRLFEKKFERNGSGYFDYSALQRSMVYINESPDRKATATLVPGKEAGTTDVVINVQDSLPVHVGFEYDNWGSRYIDKNRYSGIFEHNNLFGLDDKLFLKYQRAESSRMILEQGRYIIPVTRDFDLGAYFLTSKIRLGKEFQQVDARGTADLFGFYGGYTLLSSNELDLRLNAGFDYKRIRNYTLGQQLSRDAVRIAKFGSDVDFIDPFGRNIILPEVQFGLSDVFGGMKPKNDPNASRAGAGGRFTKGLLTYYRLQSLPFSTSLLWKNNAQYSNNILVASEEFQIGGPTSVRGYGPGEYSGDSGLYSSPELSVPLYFLPKGWNVPWNTETLYDTTRVVLFYDWASVKLNRTAANEDKFQTLRGYGFGFRFNLRDNLTFRVEVGYPLEKMPADGDHAHPWVEFTSKF